LRAGREKRNAAIGAFLTAVAGFDPGVCFLHACGLVKDGEGELPEAARKPSGPPYISDTGQLRYDPQARRMVISAPQAAGVFGYLGEDTVEAGSLEFALGPSARGFATILVTALDGRPIEESSHLLVSTPGATFRSQPGADPPRPQRLVNYTGTQDWFTLEPEPGYPNKPSGNLNGGVAPVWMERVESRLVLRTQATRLTVYPLDSAGRRGVPLDERWVQPTEGGFRIHLQAEGQTLSPWYEITTQR